MAIWGQYTFWSLVILDNTHKFQIIENLFHCKLQILFHYLITLLRCILELFQIVFYIYNLPGSDNK